MKAELTAIVVKDGDWWVGWIEEIPGANAQEQSREELLISLKAAALDIVELNRQAAINATEKDYEEVIVAI